MTTAEDLAQDAAQWFAALSGWPSESVETEIKRDHAYGVKAVLLMLAVCNDGKWPPMPPQQFAESLLRVPGMIEQIVRYAKNMMLVEFRK